MRLRHTIALLVTAVIPLGLAAQVRDSVATASSSRFNSNNYSYSQPHSSIQSRESDPQTEVKGGTGIRDTVRFERPRDQYSYANYGGRGGRIYSGNPCYRGSCYYYRSGYYPYAAVPVYVETSNGPDFSAQPSAYATYGPAPESASAASLEAAYRQGALEQKITSLADEVARLRAEKEARLESKAEVIESRPAVASQMTAVLVFRDGHRLEVGNYAVVGKALWVLDEHRARKISLDELDLPATKRLNAESGIEFLIPGSK